MTLRLVLRLAVRDWRAGELRLLLAAVVVAVGTVTAIGFFVDRLREALLSESTTFLGADRVIGSTRPVPQGFRDAARDLGITHTDVVTFPSMLFADESEDARSQLVSVKAVGDGYPLRGVLRVAEEPFGPAAVTRAVPARGEVWLDSRLFPALGLKLGDTVSVGYARLRVERVLAGEPDRGGSVFDLGPRLLMHIDDVPETRVIQPGSRVGYRLLLAGDDAALASLREVVEPDLAPNYRWRGIADANPTIGEALDRAESFLLLGGLLAVLLAGVAVALGAHRYARRHYDHVGVLKTLGATPADVQWGYLGVLTAVGAAGVATGLVLGALVHLAIVAALAAYLPASLPLPGPRPLALGAVTGFVCLLAFALPPLLALRDVSPMRVIRRDVHAGAASRVVTYGSAALGGLGLLVWYSGDVWLTLWALVGGVGVCGAFAVLALALLRGGRVVGMQAGSAWRLALAGLQRRYRENVAQITIFGIAIMLLLILLLIRTALLDEWRAQLPENAPNHFVMNVADDEVEAVQTLLAGYTDYDGGLFPMIRGRVTSVNGQPAEEWARTHRRGPDGPRLRSERNLTWSDTLPGNNVLVAGEWWPEGTDAALISLEAEYAAQHGLGIGDELSFDIGGLPVTARVANTRTVEWDSLQPNFFIVFSGAALRDFATTHMTSFHLGPEGKPFLNRLLSEHPTITVIEVDEIIRQVRSIVGRVTQAIELVLGLVLGAGALVLVASIQASHEARLKEHALVRALGGTMKLIAGSLTAEFAVLGAFAGVVAVVGAEITVTVLRSRIFELGYDLHPWLWVTGPAIGAVLIALIGYLGTRKLVESPPALVLREL